MRRALKFNTSTLDILRQIRPWNNARVFTGIANCYFISKGPKIQIK